MGNEDDTGSSSGSQVSAVTAVKLPAFSRENVEIWFMQTEFQFELKNITSEVSKFKHTVSALDPEVARDAQDLIKAYKDSATPYTDLKKRLTSIHAESEEKQLRRLFNEIEIGDKKPSALLREMQRLAGTKVSDDLMKTLFIQQLPANIQAVVATSTDTVTTIAEMADKIHDITGQAPQIAAFSNDSLSEQIKKLGEQIQALSSGFRTERHNRKRSATPSRSRSRSKSRNRGKQTSNENFCWYHNNYGKDAKKCSQPCSFAPEN